MASDTYNTPRLHRSIDRTWQLDIARKFARVLRDSLGRGRWYHSLPSG